MINTINESKLEDIHHIYKEAEAEIKNLRIQLQNSEEQNVRLRNQLAELESYRALNTQEKEKP